MPDPVSATVAAASYVTVTGIAGGAAGATIATAALASAGAFSLGSILTSTLISAALSGASSLIMGSQQQDFTQRGQTLSFRQAAAAAQIVYGRTRVGGPIIFMTTSGGARETDNQLLWVVVALAGHEVAEIGDVYFNDEVVSFKAESILNVNGFRGTAIGSQQTDPGGGLGQDDGYAYCIKRLGAFDQAINPNFVNPPGFHNLKYYGTITDADTFAGIAHLSMTFIYAVTLFPGGPPNASAVVKGRKVYDPRNPAHDIDDPSTWEWSDNWALCVADYLRGCPMDTGGGVIIRPYGVQARDDEIDWDSIIEAANISDESVQVLTGGTEARYTCNGLLDTDISPEEALKSLLSAGAGHLAWTEGKWRLLAGAYRTPTVSLGDDDQCGPARTQAKRPRRDLFNGVKGKFRGPKTLWQATDFPPVGGLSQAETYVEQDNGEEIWQDFELPFTDSPGACQRIARIELQRNRQQIVTERRFKLSALGTQVGDVIQLTDSRKGWVNKAFEIHKWTLNSVADENGHPFLCIDMVLHETSSGVYDWTVDDEFAFDDAPDTNLPRPWEVAVPGAPGIVEELYQTREGAGVRTRVTVSWADAGEGYFLDYIPEFKLSSATEWSVLPPVTSTSVIINDLGAGIYDFRVRTRNRLGVTSSYTTTEALTVYGLGAQPSAPSGVGIQAQGNQALIAWTQSVDLDVREGGFTEFRHSPAFTGAEWETATSIREAVPGAATSATLPLKAGTYILRHVDSSGIVSDITTVTSKQASVNGYVNLAGSPITEESDFGGTHNFTLVTGGVLKLSNDGLWDDIADLDLELGNIDDLGGLSLTGTYAFQDALNAGAVTRMRLTSHIAASSVDLTSGNIDDRAELIDDWETFDGTTLGGVADAWVECRTTDDDPTGSPDWGPWMRLDTGEFECWGAEFRAQLRSFDEAYNIEITELRVAAEELA